MKKAGNEFPPGDLNPEADIALQFLHSDIYAMVIYEELEVPIEYLSNLAVENALNIASDIVVVMKEYRIVNGEKVICMRMDGTMQGMKISYMTYFFSGDDGSLQFHVFTGQKLVEKHIEEIEKLLNGLMVNLD
ncbi:MAG: hypothetical protein JJU02_16750 [Cryomorphaceae bacterium]|nr:hypothetical protein [Cryomorphaceae bacterium]